MVFGNQFAVEPVTDQLMTYSRVLLVKATGSKLVKKFHIKLLCCLFTHFQFFPHFCNNHLMISISVILKSKLLNNTVFTGYRILLLEHVL